jgi:pimeloyl-ACP methyl ester carboxylesterase
MKNICKVFEIAVIGAVIGIAIGLAGCLTAQASEKTVGDDYRFNTKEISCNNNGKNIYGVAYIPVNTGEKMPVVIFSHGYGGTNRNGRVYAEALARKGIAAYCFDFSGGSPASRSDGKTTEMSVFTEKGDLEAVIEMVKSFDFADTNKLFLLGESQGGMVSAMTAADQPDTIRGLILIFPAFVITDDAQRKYTSLAEIPDEVEMMGMRIGRRYYDDIWDYDIYKHIAAYDKDVLIIHGDRDQLVPVFYSEKAAEIYPSSQLKIIPGAGHGFQGEDEKTAITYELEYVERNIH